MAGSLNIDTVQAKAFWSKVAILDDKSKCWEWQGAKTPKGYGNVRINKKYLKAHRVAWELANFQIPSGYVVMHLCDNPACCNPNHLVLGTIMSNFCDMCIKGRDNFYKNKAVGSRNHNAKLSPEIVRSIRKEYGRMNQYELADKYGVAQTAISSVLLRKTWRHVV